MRKETAKYQLTSFIRFMGDAFIYPFLAYYLRSIGLQNSDVGKIMMILPMVAIFVNPIWSKLSKNINYNRMFIRILTIVEAVAVIILANIGANIWLIILIIFIIGVAGQPFYILFDTYTVTYCNAHDEQYSKIRIMGTLAYAITVIISGVIVSQYGYKTAFYVGSSLFVVTSLLINFIKPINVDIDQTLSHKPEPKELLKNIKYWKYVFVVTFTLTSMFIFDTYLPTFFRDIYELNEMHYGFVVAAYVAIELIILILLNIYGRRIPHIYLYMAMIISLVIRYGVYALAGFIQVPLGVIIAVTMIRAFPISISIFMMMDTIASIVKPYNVTIATILMGSIRSAFNTVFVLIGGLLTENPANYKIWFLMGVGFTLLSLPFIDYKASKEVRM
ncbi:MAG: MFS transporter [Acholeplasmataceae bacterium]|jgi:predicted MFS family arabinose efflux permease